jgi:ABC-2 type transport system permease protein
LKKLLRYFKIYFMIISQSAKTRLQYRADFIVGAIGILAMNSANIAFLSLVYSSIPSIKGWTYYELLFFYGFFTMAISPQQLFFSEFLSLSGQLQSGWFIRYYFRPINIMFNFISQRLDLKSLVQMAFGIILLVVSIRHLHIVWSLPKVLFLLVNYMSASLIMIAIIAGAMSSAFWIINANSLAGKIAGISEFARYPLDIYNGILRCVFTFIAPIGFIAFYPCQLLLRPISDVSIVAWFSPVVGFIMSGIAYAIWKNGIKHYTGTGT